MLPIPDNYYKSSSIRENSYGQFWFDKRHEYLKAVGHYVT